MYSVCRFHRFPQRPGQGPYLMLSQEHVLVAILHWQAQSPLVRHNEHPWFFPQPEVGQITR